MSRLKEIVRLGRRVPGVRNVIQAGDPARRATFLAASGLIDTDLYARQLDIPSISVEDAATHYARDGHAQGLTINVLLDPVVIARHLIRTERPVLFDYLNSRAWFAHASGLWDALEYKSEFPESIEHPGGPAGHLQDRLRNGAPFPAAPGGPRELAWDEVYQIASERLVDAAARRRRKIARLAHTRTDVPRAEAGALPDDATAPLVSIIMPVWNRAGAMRRAIDSVLAQTWDRWELLVVDDGSWDDTLRVADAVAARDPRIRVIRGEHVGVSAARNRGIAAAGGDYIAFLDSDNTWEPGFLGGVVVTAVRTKADATYATIALHGDGPTRYRDQSADFASLLEGNAIDLNTLLVSRRAMDEAGGFDTRLERAVDYDLILKIAARHRLVHVDVLGAAYDDRAEATDRISRSEALGWNIRVRLAHDPAARSSGDALTSGTEILWLVQPDDPLLDQKLNRAVDLIESDDQIAVRMVLVGATPGDGARADIAAIARPRLSVGVFDGDEPFAYVVNLAAASVSRSHFAVIDPRADPPADAIHAMTQALTAAADDVGATMPLAIAPDGTLLGAGAGLARPGVVPHLLLAEHPEADAPRETIRVPLLTGRSFAVRTEAFRTAGGFDPLLFDEYDTESLSLRIDGDLLLVPAARFWHPHTEAAFVRIDPEADARRIRQSSARSDSDDGAALYAAAGLELTGWNDDGSGARPIPLVRRVPRPANDGAPSLRWAIKIAAPAGPRGETWGDTYFGHALARSLRALGHDAVVDVRESAQRSTRYLDDVDLVIRGLDTYERRSAAITILWVISHPDDLSRGEVRAYDAVFAASLAWSRRMSERWGVDIQSLLQCSDPHLFHPRGVERTGDLVFVGNSRWVPRPAVVTPVQAGVAVQVYGGDWEPFIDESHIVASRIDGEAVAARYESAAAVLNDHWSDMRREGFISNRLFDVVSAGGRAISDDVEGINDLFGSAVVTYADVDELLAVVQGDLDDRFGDAAEVAAIAETVRADHSFLARAGRLVDAARALL